MKLALAVSAILLGAMGESRADVDTLECNTAVAVRIQYAKAPHRGDDTLGAFYGQRQSGAFCLLLNGETVNVDIDGLAFSVHFDPRPRGLEELGAGGSALGMITSIALAPDDLAGRSFYMSPMVSKPYDRSTDGNWQYTPMWMEFDDAIRISVGERESGTGA